MYRTYKLTRNFVVEIAGKKEAIYTGSTVILAGKELSIMSNRSPFHYKGDIIRLPHNILEEVIDTCETKKVEKVWVLTTNQDLNGSRFPRDYDRKPTEADILQYVEEMQEKVHFNGVKLEFYYRISNN